VALECTDGYIVFMNATDLQDFMDLEMDSHCILLILLDFGVQKGQKCQQCY